MADPFTRKIVHNVRQSIGRAPVEMIFKVHSKLELLKFVSIRINKNLATHNYEIQITYAYKISTYLLSCVRHFFGPSNLTTHSFAAP